MVPTENIQAKLGLTNPNVPIGAQSMTTKPILK